MPTTIPARYQAPLAALGVLTPITALLMFAGYSCDRVVAAWRNEDGLSKTVEVAIWTFLALGAAVGVGAILIPALRNRASDTQTDIENTPLP